VTKERERDNQEVAFSAIHRQNALNNPYALKQAEEELGLGGILYNGQPVFTINQASHIFKVDRRTIERAVSEHNEELSRNGYIILRGIELRKFKELSDATDTDVGSIDPKSSQVSIFSFRAFLNLSMLLTNSEKAKFVRSKILHIVTQVLVKKAGDRTFINQRDEDYLPAAFQEENYRKEFTAAVNQYVKGNQWKYKHCTDAIYKSIFKERATEYRKILNIESQHNVRDTFYSELITLIASFEAGLPEVLQKESEAIGKPLPVKDAMILIENFGNQRLLAPHIQEVRTKMATRDYTLRDAVHNKLEAYIQAMPEADYERFLGDKSIALQERIDEQLDVYKRLKDR